MTATYVLVFVLVAITTTFVALAVDTYARTLRTERLERIQKIKADSLWEKKEEEE